MTSMTFCEATIITHCAVIGRIAQRARAYRVDAVEPYAQYPVSVRIAFIEPRKRIARVALVVPTNLRYLTIEVAGREVYDSRADVPCDMEQWAAADREHQERDARSKAAYIPRAGVRTAWREDNV